MQLHNYYEILNLNHDFKRLKLFLNYLNRASVALKSNNQERFVEVRQGFEVLREDQSLENYNRIYKKYILNIELNYPELKEKEMIDSFRIREQKAKKIAEKTFLNKETHQFYFTKVLVTVIGVDLIHIIARGSSGLVLYFIAFYLFITKDDYTNRIGSVFILAIGTIFLIRNFNRFINR